jgi:DMSO/TMAO reductase YedYZ molybdopterin-dependent catalytic subunit
VRLTSILDLAGGAKPDTSVVAAIAADEYTSAFPWQVAMDPETLLVYEMNGEVLPYEHGYPARLLVPGRYGMKNAKWVIGLRPLQRDFVDWYGQRNWTRDAVINTMSRIDLPTRDAELSPGRYNIAGIAYAGTRRIRLVEFSTDGGESWQRADFVEPPIGHDVWVRWIGEFTLERDARLTLVARATDGTGMLQTEAFVLPQPDGSSGWPSLDVRARQN